MKTLRKPPIDKFSKHKNLVVLQTSDVILFNDFNEQEVRIKALFDSGSQRSYISKHVHKILSPEIKNKEKIKANTFSSNKSKEKISDYVKLSVKTEKENKSFEAFSISLMCLSDSNEIRTHSHLIRKRTLNHLVKLAFKKSFATKKSTCKIPSRKLPAPPKFEFCRFWNKIRRNRSTDRFRLLMGICICKGEM